MNTHKKKPEPNSNDVRRDNRLKEYIWPECVCPKGTGVWGEWEETDGRLIQLRSKEYMSNNVKIESQRSLFKLAHQDFVKVKLEESSHIASREHSWYARHQHELPKDTFHLIFNIQLQSLELCIVSYYVIRTDEQLYENSSFVSDSSVKNMANNHLTDEGVLTHTPSISSRRSESNLREKQELYENLRTMTRDFEQELLEDQAQENPNNEEKADASSNTSLPMPKLQYEPLDGPIGQQKHALNLKRRKRSTDESRHHSLWEGFLAADSDFINDRLKLIPNIVKTPWYLPIPGRPALLGHYSPQKSHRGRNYLEIDCEADATMLAQQIVRAAHNVSKKIIVDIVWVIEGRCSSELPERCLGGVRLFNVNATMAQAPKIPKEKARTDNNSSNTDGNG